MIIVDVLTVMATLYISQISNVSTQPGELPAFQGSSFPVGYSVMGYARPAFSLQRPFMNSNYQMLPANHMAHMTNPTLQQQGMGNQLGQGQANNLYLNYGTSNHSPAPRL